MFRIRKQFKFEAAHALVDSYSKCCQVIHGHSYIVEVIIEGPQLDDTGMLIDFGKLKEICQPTINAFDHALILQADAANQLEVVCRSTPARVTRVDMNVLAVPYSPTAEAMARDLFGMWRNAIAKQSAPGACLATVRLHETDTGWAEFSE